MKGAKFSEEQSRKPARRPTSASDTVSAARPFLWKAKYGEMDVSDASKRLKALEEERKLSGLEDPLDRKMVTPAARRTAVAHLTVTYEMSERRACHVVAADRSSVRYRSQRPDDVAVRERLRALAAERMRPGGLVPGPPQWADASARQKRATDRHGSVGEPRQFDGGTPALAG